MCVQAPTVFTGVVTFKSEKQKLCCFLNKAQSVHFNTEHKNIRDYFLLCKYQLLPLFYALRKEHAILSLRLHCRSTLNPRFKPSEAGCGYEVIGVTVSTCHTKCWKSLGC